MLVWSLTFYLKDPFHGLFSFQMFNFILQSAKNMKILICEELIEKNEKYEKIVDRAKEECYHKRVACETVGRRKKIKNLKSF